MKYRSADIRLEDSRQGRKKLSWVGCEGANQERPGGFRVLSKLALWFVSVISLAWKRIESLAFSFLPVPFFFCTRYLIDLFVYVLKLSSASAHARVEQYIWSFLIRPYCLCTCWGFVTHSSLRLNLFPSKELADSIRVFVRNCFPPEGECSRLGPVREFYARWMQWTNWLGVAIDMYHA
jgi:hypothetical protein